MLKIILGVSRANFLTLAPVCVALAASYSDYQSAWPDAGTFGLVLFMALAAHISVNAFNEYFDFHSGLDAMTRRTPFSGGSGTLIAYPDAHPTALAVAVISLLMVIIPGLWLVANAGLDLLLIGVAGVAIIYFYTQWINRSPLLCLLAPGVGFGLLMTLGAMRVFPGTLDAGAWALSGVITLLVSNLLLLNQFPDVEADRAAGRRHYPIVLGRPASAILFAALLLLAYLVVIGAVFLRWLPVQALLSLVSLVLAIPLAIRVRKYADNLNALVPVLGMNVALCHLFPLTLILGLVWAGT